MEKCKRPLYLLLSFVLPHVLILAHMGYSVAMSSQRYEYVLGALAFAVISAIAYSLLNARAEGVPPAVLFGFMAATIGSCIWLLYLHMTPPAADRPVVWRFGITAPYLHMGISCVSLFLLGSMLYAQTGTASPKVWKRMMLLGVCIPVLCALIGHWPLKGSSGDVIVLYSCCALLCATAYFVICWAIARIKEGAHVHARADALRTAPQVERSPETPADRRFGAVIVIAVLLPQVGLLANAQLGNLFGDFSNIWFYVIALLNGLCMLSYDGNKRIKMLLTFGKLVGLPYIIYFTVIFLPMLPFGLFGIVIFFLGLITFAPLVVFLMEIFQLRRDWQELCQHFPKSVVRTTYIVGLCLLPAMVIGAAFYERVNLQKAIVYAEQPEHARAPYIGRFILTNTINDVNRWHAEEIGAPLPRGWRLWDSTLPLLDSMRRRMVYDGVTLNTEHVIALYNTFYSDQAADANSIPNMSSWGIRENEYFQVNVKADTADYDEANRLYRTWVHMEVTPITSGYSTIMSELDERILLPSGSFITDYYLDIGEKRKYGILSEKNIAVDMYEGNLARAVDPGLLIYVDDSAFRLRVFPFNKDETRRTGFQVMHTAPIQFMVANRVFQIDVEDLAHPLPETGGHSLSCTPDTCAETLPYGDNAYDNAFALEHNARVKLNSSSTLAESFRQRVLTPGSAFVVLETDAQDRQLLAKQERIMNGEEVDGHTIPMDESLTLGAALGFVALLLLWHAHRRRGAARRHAA